MAMDTPLESEGPPEKFRLAATALLIERQQLLVAYADMLDIDLEQRESLAFGLQTFNQLLTDYAAAGHFEVFEPAWASCAREPGVSDELSVIRAQLGSETDGILKFSERYGRRDVGSHNLIELAEDLERLGPLLAERFEQEDRLLRLLAL